MAQKDTIELLGDFLDQASDIGRDAVHVAVMPVYAAELLFPGQSVKFVAGSNSRVVGTDTNNRIGIIDPFLSVRILPEDRVWLFLNPMTITSLRHVWSHPKVLDEDVKLDFSHEEIESDYVKARKWIEDFASRTGLEFEELVEAADEYLSRGDYLVKGGLLEGESVPDEFWDMYEIYRDEKVDDYDRGNFFSCSC